MRHTIHQKIAELQALKTDRFDPVRFCYIRSMARRANGKPNPVRDNIIQKVTAALAEYETDYASERNAMGKNLHQLCERFPKAADTFRVLFENNEFKKIRQNALELRCKRPSIGLLEITDRFKRLITGTSEPDQMPCLDELLLQEESRVLASIDDSAQAPSPAPQPAPILSKSFQRMKKTLKRLNSERRVIRAVQNSPENAGPHNSQMLAATTLSILKDLSPDYLDRIIAHIETLIRLKEAGENMGKNQSKKKKTTSPRQ